jgi:signal transduction histidine kinase
LIGISFVVIVFVILTGLLITFSSRLKKQKKELEIANGEIKRMNENLENIVSQRTKLLAEANRELDTFLYRASHDLRSPVCSIIGLCNIALQLSHGESKELVQKVATTTEGMDKLLKKLSIISEINQPTNYSSITLLEVIEDVQYKFIKIINDHKIKIKVDCSADLVFYSYPSLIETVISNLIENALFYSIKRDPQHAHVEFKASIVDEQLEFSVFDNGIGIEDAIRTHLFDMFFKGHIDSKGNGLGLYIVQKSVQAMEGTIAIESEKGSYSRFVVRIPFNTTPSKEEFEAALI